MVVAISIRDRPATAPTHVYGLIALAIGVTPEGRELASRRGLRAARLEAIKADLIQNVQLGLDQLAVRQGISPRYVQMLFEQAGTTFSDFVLERPLDAAHSTLASPRYATWSITEVAPRSRIWRSFQPALQATLPDDAVGSARADHADT